MTLEEFARTLERHLEHTPLETPLFLPVPTETDNTKTSWKTYNTANDDFALTITHKPPSQISTRTLELTIHKLRTPEEFIAAYTAAEQHAAANGYRNLTVTLGSDRAQETVGDTLERLQEADIFPEGRILHRQGRPHHCRTLTPLTLPPRTEKTIDRLTRKYFGSIADRPVSTLQPTQRGIQRWKLRVRDDINAEFSEENDCLTTRVYADNPFGQEGLVRVAEEAAWSAGIQMHFVYIEGEEDRFADISEKMGYEPLQDISHAYVKTLE